jgi:hypothetical protein
VRVLVAVRQRRDVDAVTPDLLAQIRERLDRSDDAQLRLGARAEAGEQR